MMCLNTVFFGDHTDILKVAGNTLGALLCIHLKRMHEVKRLISTGLRDLHNWIKDERII